MFLKIIGELHAQSKKETLEYYKKNQLIINNDGSVTNGNGDLLFFDRDDEIELSENTPAAVEKMLQASAAKFNKRKPAKLSGSLADKTNDIVLRLNALGITILSNVAIQTAGTIANIVSNFRENEAKKAKKTLTTTKIEP